MASIHILSSSFFFVCLFVSRLFCSSAFPVYDSVYNNSTDYHFLHIKDFVYYILHRLVINCVLVCVCLFASLPNEVIFLKTELKSGLFLLSFLILTFWSLMTKASLLSIFLLSCLEIKRKLFFSFLKLLQLSVSTR